MNKNKQFIKKSIFICILFFVVLQNSFALSKNEIDKYYEIAKNTNESTKYDLIDYIPHSDGEIVLYNIKENLIFSYIGVYSSMYRKQFFLIIDGKEICGYCEKSIYKSPYDSSDYEVEPINYIQVEKTTQSIEKSSEKKILHVLYEILNSDFQK